jgi:hypothetical protein
MRARAVPLLIMGTCALALSGCAMFGGGARDTGKAAAAGSAGIGVNSFLWRASLDTLSFMPLSAADPFGGTILTDWYASPERPSERFKVTVYILDTRLRADGLKVSLFRQTRGVNGIWADADADPDTSLQLENAILTRARQLRLATIEGGKS